MSTHLFIPLYTNMVMLVDILGRFYAQNLHPSIIYGGGGEARCGHGGGMRAVTTRSSARRYCLHLPARDNSSFWNQGIVNPLFQSSKSLIDKELSR